MTGERALTALKSRGCNEARKSSREAWQIRVSFCTETRSSNFWTAYLRARCVQVLIDRWTHSFPHVFQFPKFFTECTFSRSHSPVFRSCLWKHDLALSKNCVDLALWRFLGCFPMIFVIQLANDYIGINNHNKSAMAGGE